MATAVEIKARDQPNSASSGTISKLGVERTPAAGTNTRNVTAAIAQA